MSGYEYISSLILDPVFRQARRFSRQDPVVAPQAFAAPSEDRNPSPSTSAAAGSSTDEYPESVASPGITDSEAEVSKVRPDADSASRILRAADVHVAITDSYVRSEASRDDIAEPTAINDERRINHTDTSPLPRTQNSNNDYAEILNDLERWSIAEQGDRSIAFPRNNMQDSGQLRQEHASLPADDGMGHLRRRIQKIRDAEVSHSEKARQIHTLMTEAYNSKRVNPPNSRRRNSSDVSWRQENEPPSLQTEASPRVLNTLLNTSCTDEGSSSIGNRFNIKPEDLVPSFVPLSNQGEESDISMQESDSRDLTQSQSEDQSLGCRHYKRNVKLQCYDCRRWYACRFCHDENEEHRLNRRATENMLCMLCWTPQPAGEWCISCGELAACYYCAVCKLWNNDPEKSIYHCHDCGICRRGEGIGKDFFHCKTCAVCINISIEKSHRCIERSTQCDCPICGEYMFTSPDRVVFMKCGHSIHHKCFTEYAKRSYRCPICGKSVTNMETQFRNLDRTIQAQPMPAEFANARAMVYCNDCSARTTVSFHWLGLKCGVCDSYNTNQLQLIGLTDTSLSDRLVTHEEATTNTAGQTSETTVTATYDIEAAPDQRPVTPTAAAPRDIEGRRPATSASQQGFLTSPQLNPSLRTARSVSPSVGNYFGIRHDEPTHSPRQGTLGAPQGETAGIDFGFWSRLSPGRLPVGSLLTSSGEDESGSDDQGSAEDDDDDIFGEALDEMDDDDEEDQEDEIALFGHR